MCYFKSQDDDDNVYKALVDPLTEEVEALKEKIREMDTDISYYKTKLNESKDNVVEQQITTSMYLYAFIYILNALYVYNNNVYFIDNSQEESSNSSATSDFVFFNTSIGK